MFDMFCGGRGARFRGQGHLAVPFHGKEVPMLKNSTGFGKRYFPKTALIILGWICFLIGFVVNEPVIKIFSLGIARVLPHTLFSVR